MKKAPFLCLILLGVCPCLFSQRTTEDFEISLPEKKVYSLYSEISFVDSRYDTSSMGIVQLGAFNRKAAVIPKKHFSLQLPEVLRALNDGAAEDGKLLFQLRQFNFVEVTRMSERGFCYLRAELYAKSNDQYQKIGLIDTIIMVKSLDVTRTLFRRASRAITDFISVNLERKPDQAAVAYTIEDVKNIDNIEKRQIPLYANSALADGLYLSYRSFSNLVPDHQAVVEMKDNKIYGVRIKGPDGKPAKSGTNYVYAVVHEGKAYVNTEYGYYELTKRENDFLFIGKAKVSGNTADVIAAGVFFGIIGSLMASNATATFELKIDHLNGTVIPIREKAESERELRLP
jgi:hypothetical protein